MLIDLPMVPTIVTSIDFGDHGHRPYVATEPSGKSELTMDFASANCPAVTMPPLLLMAPELREPARAAAVRVTASGDGPIERPRVGR